MITATRADTGWGRFRADLQAEILARIPEHLERLSWSAERIEAAQRDGLRRLLAHAVAHSPFHRQRLAGTAVAGIEPADLASLPVMTKTDMMAAIDDVFTDRRLTLAADRAGAGRHRQRARPGPRPVHGSGDGREHRPARRVRLRSGRESRVHPLDHPVPAGPASRGRRDPTGRAAHGHGRRRLGRPRHRRRRRRDDRARHAAPHHVGPRHLAVAADSGPPQRPPGPPP